MADIEKIIDGLNIPKQVLDKSEQLLKTLFGPSFEEIGGLIADQVKLRRFNNQINIFTKAQEKLKQNNISPKQISLKVLAPLIEFSSLEEEENLQDKWSNLIAHILGGNKDVVFQQNSMTILNRLSSEEAKLLDKLHEILSFRRVKQYNDAVKTFEKMSKQHPSLFKDPPKQPETYSLDSFVFNISKVSTDINIPIPELEFSISNLIALGLLKWETDVEVNASKSSYDPDDDGIDVDVSVYNNDNFIFTSIGDKFIKVCKS
ncbi:MAG: hypothetical protein RJA07_2761 [Bacteroidota bacterium]|jgi:hypothetical protein